MELELKLIATVVLLDISKVRATTAVHGAADELLA
jgi:hypothetical protein